MKYYSIKEQQLEDIASAIRRKTHLDGLLTVDEMPGKIDEISGTPTDIPTLENPGDASKLLEGYELVGADGQVIEGTMPLNESNETILQWGKYSYQIPEGYHDGTGIVKVQPEIKTFTPHTLQDPMMYDPSEGKMLAAVIINPIPDEYQDITGVTATADDVMEGKTIVDATGATVEGAFTISEELSEQEALITQIGEALDGRIFDPDVIDDKEYYIIINNLGVEVNIAGFNVPVDGQTKIYVDRKSITGPLCALATLLPTSATNITKIYPKINGKASLYPHFSSISTANIYVSAYLTALRITFLDIAVEAQDNNIYIPPESGSIIELNLS